MINSLSKTKIQEIEEIDDLEDVDNTFYKHNLTKHLTESLEKEKNHSVDCGNGSNAKSMEKDYKNTEKKSILLNNDSTDIYRRTPEILNKSCSKTEIEDSLPNYIYMVQMVKYKLN
jgi:hypothetical protein